MIGTLIIGWIAGHASYTGAYNREILETYRQAALLFASFTLLVVIVPYIFSLLNKYIRRIRNKEKV